jgi:hypothetical protein
MATPRADSYTAASGSVVYGGMTAAPGPAPAPAPAPVVPYSETTFVPDGIWTWFTRPEAIQHGGAIYIGWVNRFGTCGASRLQISDGSIQHIQLSAVGMEVDDHNNTSLVVLPDGRIAAFYGEHNDAQFKYRVWNPAAGAFSNSAAWSTEEARGLSNGPYSYPNPFVLSQTAPVVHLFQRRWVDGGGTRTLALRTATTLQTAAPHTWSQHQDIYRRTGFIPYWRLISDGTKRIHVAITDGHPVQGQISLFHFYGELDGSNAMRWYRSDGVEITASLPFGPSDATLVYDGSATRCWVSDVAIGADGRPRILWMRYPGNDGTQIEYWHARWTGSAWSLSKITDDGPGLYSPEVYYHGGLAFDARDPTRVYLSAPVAGVRQIQEWRTSDGGSTWAQHRQITSGGAAGSPLKFRPIGIQGSNGSVNVLWCEGSYTTFTNYNTAIKGSA